jgi:hypothetical protein
MSIYEKMQDIIPDDLKPYHDNLIDRINESERQNKIMREALEQIFEDRNVVPKAPGSRVVLSPGFIAHNALIKCDNPTS